MSVHPALAVAAVLGWLGAVLGAIQWCQRRRGLQPELARKLLHVGMGLTVLSFPFVFDESAPVVVLALLSVALLYGTRLVPA